MVYKARLIFDLYPNGYQNMSAGCDDAVFDYCFIFDQLNILKHMLHTQIKNVAKVIFCINGKYIIRFLS